jgi:hypothetical protein
MIQHELVKQATEILAIYRSIQNRPMKYAHEDEAHWKKHELPKLEGILDELHIQTDPQFAEEVESKEAQEKYQHYYDRELLRA